MKVLVAEDDAVSRAVIVRQLELLGHAPIPAQDGREAWQLFDRHRCPLVITDWEMPGLDGLELVRRIRALRSPDYTWVIMLTIRSFDDNYAQTMEVGVDDYLTKPLNRDLLRVRLTVAKRVLEMSRRIRHLESCLPVCMSCRSVRNESQSWQKLEQYIVEHSHLDLSHGLCPPCFFETSLRPEIERMLAPERIESLAVRSSSRELLDGAYWRRLQSFDEEEAPNLVEDLVEAFLRSVREDLLPAMDRSKISMDDAAVRDQLSRFRQRALFVGAWRLVSVVEAFLSRGEQAETRLRLKRMTAQVCQQLEERARDLLATSDERMPALQR